MATPKRERQKAARRQKIEQMQRVAKRRRSIRRGSFVALAGAGLWIGLNASHFSPIGLTSSDLRIGAWLTIGGALAGFIAAFFLRRRVV